jgi:hypothetical protein
MLYLCYHQQQIIIKSAIKPSNFISLKPEENRYRNITLQQFQLLDAVKTQTTKIKTARPSVKDQNL